MPTGPSGPIIEQHLGVVLECDGEPPLVELIRCEKDRFLQEHPGVTPQVVVVSTRAHAWLCRQLKRGKRRTKDQGYRVVKRCCGMAVQEEEERDRTGQLTIRGQ